MPCRWQSDSMNTPLPPARHAASSGGVAFAVLFGAGVFFVTGVLWSAPPDAGPSSASASVTKPAPASASAATPTPPGKREADARAALAPSSDAPPAAITTPESVLPVFSYVHTHWQPAQDFKRISEYFTGREEAGEDVVVRTDAAERFGMYFRIGLPLNTTFPPGSVLLVDYIRGDSPAVRTRSFELPPLSYWPFAELRVGLTGKDWPGKAGKSKEQDEKLRLVAWRLTLKDAQGTTLFRQHSFLWKLPPVEQLQPPAHGTKATPAGTAQPATPVGSALSPAKNTENGKEAK